MNAPALAVVLALWVGASALVAWIVVRVVAIPVLAVVVLLQARDRRRGLRGGCRPSTWYWRWWWRFGYAGLYQLDWATRQRWRRMRGSV